MTTHFSTEDAEIAMNKTFAKSIFIPRPWITLAIALPCFVPILGCGGSRSEAVDVYKTKDSIVEQTEVIDLRSKKKNDIIASGSSKNTNSKDPKKVDSTDDTSNTAKADGTWILSEGHHMGGQLDGQKLVEYFQSQNKDIDEEIFLVKPDGVSLKEIKRVTFAINQNVLQPVRSAAIAGNYQLNNLPSDWLALVQFKSDIPQSAWQSWLVPFSNKTVNILGREFITISSSKMGLTWVNNREFLYGSEQEVRNALENLAGHIESGKIARSISANKSKQLVYFAMDMRPFRKMVNDLSKMADQFYPGWLDPYRKEIAAVEGWELFEFWADAKNEEFGRMELAFADSPEAKVFQEFINNSLQTASATDTSNPSTDSSLTNSFFPAMGTSETKGGLGSQLQKLAMDIKDELLQGGTTSLKKEKTAGLLFKRPKKLDQLITSAMSEFRTSQGDWIRVARVRKIYHAICQYQTKNESFPPAEFFGMTNPTTEKGFSWRVAILPALGYQALYDKFHFDEPWDSPHNIEVAKEIPLEFCGHALPTKENPNPCSCFQLIGGKNGLAGDPSIKDAEDIPDDADRTFLLIQTNETKLWTEPCLFELVDISSLQAWNQTRQGISTLVLASGRIVMLPQEIDCEKLFPWFTPAGKERIRRKTVLKHTVVEPVSR